MRIVVAVLLALAIVTASASTADEEQQEPAREIGLVEETGRRLLQLDVSVSGPSETIANLKADDFQLAVGGRPVEEFYVDAVCGGQPPPPSLADSPGFEALAESSTPVVSVSYLFYFDQNHLTFEGRRRSLEVARSLIPELIFAPNRAMVVSSGRRVQVLTGWTSDQRELLDAIDHIEQHPEEGDVYPMREDERVLHVRQVLDDALDAAAIEAQRIRMEQKSLAGAIADAVGDLGPVFGQGQVYDPYRDGDEAIAGLRSGATSQAENLARMYGREEKWRTELGLTRFSMVLTRLATLPPPKAAIYFADRMRSNAGEHYSEIFRSYGALAVNLQKGALSAAERSSTAGAKQATSRVIAFDQLLDQASAHGVRLYTVQGEGIVSGYQPTPTSAMSFKATNESILVANRRFADARASLGSLAHETGGRTFLHGAQAESIADEIRSDLTCFYILSLDATGFPEDKALPIQLRVTRPDVTASTRGRVVIQSEESKLQTELTAAFIAPEGDHGGPPLRATVVPLGFEKGVYSALVQVAVPGSPRPNAIWDLGLSLISGTRVPWKTSRRLAVTSAGVPLILELVVPFDPGSYELVMVAREVGAEVISAGLLEGEWPRPADHDASIGPIAMLQPGSGAFVREDSIRRQGSIAQDDMAMTELPTALVGIVCRPGKDPLVVQRTLVGASSATFPPLVLEDAKKTCSVFSDTIPADTMTSGSFRYEVRVVDEGTEVAVQNLEFMAATASDLDGL